MQVHPKIEALRSNRVSQRQAQDRLVQAVSQWRAAVVTQRLEKEFSAYAEGVSLKDCSNLRAILDDHHAALGWIGGLAGMLFDALRDQPLGEVPFSSQRGDNYAALRMLKAGNASMSVCCYTPILDAAAPESVVFSDHESLELILKGEVRGVVYRAGPHAPKTTINSRSFRWLPGDVISLDAQSSRYFQLIKDPVVTLQIARTPDVPLPTHKYRLATGERLQSASGDKLASRLHMALAVLGALEHRPALTEMQRLAKTPDIDADLRWEAVRQSLALDPSTGFGLLNTISRQASDTLARPAFELKARLLEAHPQLAHLSSEAA